MKKFRIFLIFFITLLLLLGLSVVSSKQITNNTKTVEKTIQNKNMQYIQKQKKKTATFDNSITIKANNIKTKAIKNTTFKTEVYDNKNNKVNNGTVFYKINGKTVMDADGKAWEVPVKNGIASMQYVFPKNSNITTYNLTHIYLNPKKTARQELNTLITLEKANVNFHLKNITINKGNILQFTSKITDEFNNPINKSVEVEISIDGKKLKTFKSSGTFSESISTLEYTKGLHKISFNLVDNSYYNTNKETITLNLKSVKIKSFNRYVSPVSKGLKTGLNWKNTQQLTTAINSLQYVDNTPIANIYLDNGQYNLGDINNNGSAIKIFRLNSIRTLNIIGKDSSKTIISGENKKGLFHFDNNKLKVTFKHLKFEKAKNNNGAAITSYNTNININDCIFENNVAKTFGGAIYIVNPTSKNIIIQHSKFISNKALYGGSINIFQNINNVTIKLTNTEAKKNHAMQGAFAYVNSENNININLKKSKMMDNEATDNSAGVCSYSKNGKITVDIRNCFLKNNKANANGASIYNHANKKINVILYNVTINNNQARYGGSLYSHSKFSNVTCIIQKTKATNCLTLKNGNGGVIYNKAGNTVNVKVKDSTFKKNKSPLGNGSCITNLGISTVLFTIKNSIFTNNYAMQGGAVSSWSNLNKSKIVVLRSKFKNNEAKLDGGAIYSTTDYKPLYVMYDEVVFENNTSGRMGESIFNRADLNPVIFNANKIIVSNGHSSQKGSSITNTAGTNLKFNLKNSIIKNNNILKSAKSIIYNFALEKAETIITKTKIYNNRAVMGAAVSTIGLTGTNVLIKSSEIFKNSAKNFSVIYVWAQRNNAKVKIINSKIFGNNGGKTGVFYLHAIKGNIRLNIFNSMFKNNKGNNGGAISNIINKGNLEVNIYKTKFIKNKAIEGTVLYNVLYKGKVNEKISKSIIKSNKVHRNNAIIYNHAQRITLKHNYNVINHNYHGYYLKNSEFPIKANLEKNSWGKKVNWSKILFKCNKPNKIK